MFVIYIVNSESLSPVKSKCNFIFSLLDANTTEIIATMTVANPENQSAKLPISKDLLFNHWTILINIEIINNNPTSINQVFDSILFTTLYIFQQIDFMLYTMFLIMFFRITTPDRLYQRYYEQSICWNNIKKSRHFWRNFHSFTLLNKRNRKTFGSTQISYNIILPPKSCAIVADLLHGQSASMMSCNASKPYNNTDTSLMASAFARLIVDLSQL